MTTSENSERIFGGPAYNPGLDRARLARQVERIRGYMLEEVGWRTLGEIKSGLEERYAPAHFPESSISAQLRNLRGLGYRLEKRRRLGAHGPGAGIWEYSLHPRERTSSQPQLDFLPGSLREEARMPRLVTADPNCKLCEGGGWKVVESDGRKFAASCDCRKRRIT